MWWPQGKKYTSDPAGILAAIRRNAFLGLVLQNFSPMCKGTKETDLWQGHCYIKNNFKRLLKMCLCSSSVSWFIGSGKEAVEMASAQRLACRAGTEQDSERKKNCVYVVYVSEPSGWPSMCLTNSINEWGSIKAPRMLLAGYKALLPVASSWKGRGLSWAALKRLIRIRFPPKLSYLGFSRP